MNVEAFYAAAAGEMQRRYGVPLPYWWALTLRYRDELSEAAGRGMTPEAYVIELGRDLGLEDARSGQDAQGARAAA